MKLALSTIQALGKIITGDGNISPYRSGPKLVGFFNEYGGDTIYSGSGFPSRWKFTEDELIRINGSDSIKKVIEDAVNPAHYIETEFKVIAAVEYLNQYLHYDKLKIVMDGRLYKLTADSNNNLVRVDFEQKFSKNKLSHSFILEQIDKCRDKIESSDFDGAITNSRSLVEGIFEDLIVKSGKEIPKHDGDLNKLYREVKRCLSLDESQPDLSQTLKQILTGLVSIVTGVAGVSNKMGDRHARQYQPKKHHAVLAVNSANTLCGFLISSLEYQHQRKPLNVD